MKKTTLLSFATAAAIVVTSAGTFAVWDVTSATGTASVSFTNPVNTTISAGSFTVDSTREIGDVLPSATADFKVKVENMPTDKVADYNLIIEATSADGNVTVATDTSTIPLVDGQTEYTAKIKATAIDASSTGAHDVNVNAKLVKK